LNILPGLPDASFDLIITDPPYNIHLARTMSSSRYASAHSNRRTDYDMHSDDPGDLANLPDYEAYLNAMELVFQQCFTLLKPRKYMVIIVRNAYQHGEYIFTHVDLARRAKLHGFVPKGEIIWYQNGSRLRPYGYPFAYIPNIVHQYIVVLYKPG
jgi:DNA modification methylase